MRRSRPLIAFLVSFVAGCSASHVADRDDAAVRTDSGRGSDAGIVCGDEVCGAGDFCCAGCPGEPPLGCFGGCPPIACPVPGWTHCEDALASGSAGDSCSFEGACTVDGDCCARSARCEAGSLILDRACAPGCFACASSADCGPSQFCDFSLDGCGGPGACVERPTACDTDCPGVCGCDGMSYCNACSANVAGISVARESACDAPGCAAQDAGGSGGCALFLGVRWNGAACEGIGGCSCVGADCGTLYESPEECELARIGCLTDDD